MGVGGGNAKSAAAFVDKATKEKPPAHAEGSFFAGRFREGFGFGFRQRLTSAINNRTSRRSIATIDRIPPATARYSIIAALPGFPGPSFEQPEVETGRDEKGGGSNPVRVATVGAQLHQEGQQRPGSSQLAGSEDIFGESGGVKCDNMLISCEKLLRRIAKSARSLTHWIGCYDVEECDQLEQPEDVEEPPETGDREAPLASCALHFRRA